MKRTVSPESRQKLRDKVLESACLLESEKEDIINAIVQWYEEQNTFSDVIKDGHQYYRHCPLCDQRFAIYPKHFPILMTRYLQFLAAQNRPMTVKEIMNESGFPRTADESSHFPSLRLWGLIEPVEHHKYIASIQATQFLTKQLAVPERIWVFQGERIGAPLDEVDGAMLYIDQFKHEKFNLQEVLDQSVSGFAAR